MALGRTISELQATITPAEMQIWLAYRRKYGPMNPVRQFDAGPAIVASMFANSHGGRTKASDFMPYGKHTEEIEEVEPEYFLEALSRSGGVKDGNQRR